jgi:D-threo-aldose 1-dehydrogenase
LNERTRLDVTAIGLGRQQKRDSFAISTKVGCLLRSAVAAPEDDHYKGTPAEAPRFDFSCDGVMRPVEEGLHRRASRTHRSS